MRTVLDSAQNYIPDFNGRCSGSVKRKSKALLVQIINTHLRPGEFYIVSCGSLNILHSFSSTLLPSVEEPFYRLT